MQHSHGHFQSHDHANHYGNADTNWYADKHSHRKPHDSIADDYSDSLALAKYDDPITYANAFANSQPLI